MVLLEYADLEILITQIRNASGFDFSGYARPSLLRQANRYLTKCKLTCDELLSQLEPDNSIVFDLIQEMTVNYSEMFRDPEFFIRVQSEVFTYLESYPALRFWVAGCASGEEAFSLAIMLKESGHFDRSLIYATDLNKKVLTAAREGVFTLGSVRTFSENYLRANGKNSLSDYYHVSYNKAVISPEVRKNIVFSLHDLSGDGIFNEFQFISCRNVMIYFTLELRQRVFRLLYESLSMLGFLCLGKRETLRYSGIEQNFRVVDSVLNIYQKIK